ncbi:MAG TPA: hypothetical protein VK525_18460 [Candidatus Saccharimonadales bacterium]|nr:hypothetical protein [Candidatus Saccharimonadales bacterium]
MKTADVAILGSGSLANGIVHALSQVSAGSLQIAIIGRSTAKISRMALIANARTASFGTRLFFFPLAMPQFTALAFSRAFRSLKPRVVVLAASLHSPWESFQTQSAWTKLIAAGGFGITLPLQLKFAADVSRGAANSDTAIVNACYPDGVNLVLHRLGFRPTCGIGNSAIVEAFCRSHPSVGADVRVVGHHGHLTAWLKGNSSQSQPRVWVNGKERKSLRLRPDLGRIGEELNNVTAATATRVIMSLLSGGTLHTSVPGVAGLPGGYPFVLKGRKFTLRLPSGITSAEAIAHNKTGERLDGLDLESDVKFVGKARRFLTDVGFEYAEGFNLGEWQCVCDRMVALRDRLRQTKV